MIVGITIRNFKCVREITNLPLLRFQVLVGPNGAGKSTFLDAIDFVRDCLHQGPLAAVESRGVTEFADLTWMRHGGNVEIELWLDLPAPAEASKNDGGDREPESLLFYRLAVAKDDKLGVCVKDEQLYRS